MWFFTETSLSETFLLNKDIFFELIFLFLEIASKSIFGRALIASSFEILPDLPLPLTEPGSIPFSSKIFFAAGEAIPLDDFISNFSSESLRSNC